jgi:hypothetical protein
MQREHADALSDRTPSRAAAHSVSSSAAGASAASSPIQPNKEEKQINRGEVPLPGKEPPLESWRWPGIPLPGGNGASGKVTSGNPIQRVILDEEDEPELDDVIEKAIAHLPGSVQEIIWEIHQSPEYGMTLDEAVEMAVAEAADQHSAEHSGEHSSGHSAEHSGGHSGEHSGGHPGKHSGAPSPTGPGLGPSGEKQSPPVLMRLLQEEEAIALATVELPDVAVPAEAAAEVQRQLALQIDNLNRLTAKQWLINILLNRMKTPEQQIKDDYGTGAGKKLAGKIDELLMKNGALARYFFLEVRKRMLLLLTNAGGSAGLAKLVSAVLDAIDSALKASDDKVYLEFRSKYGLERLAELQASGVQGGIGRQQGKGDEKGFRKEFEDGIALCQQSFPELDQNAVLHNPDQCIGGPFEVLWNGVHEAELLHAKDWYREAERNYQRQLRMAESYAKSPPKTTTGETDEQMMAEMADELGQLEDEVEQAAADYIEQVHIHLGNYAVNSLLGKTWMEVFPMGGLINRVDILLERVLALKPKELDFTRLDVIMKVMSTGKPVSSESGAFPDVLSKKDRPKIILGKKRGKKPQTLDDKIKAGKAKLAGPKQISLHDLIYRNEKADAGTADTGTAVKKPEEDASPAPEFLPAVRRDFNITAIDGDGLACYIRAVVTGTPGVAGGQVENLVGAITDHLAHIGIRSPNQMIDAGGLAAAEVRHSLSQLMGGMAQTPRVEIVIRDPRGGYARFTANDGDYLVILLHTGAHFDLLRER